MLIYVTLIVTLVCPERKNIVKLSSEELVIKLLNCHEKLHFASLFSVLKALERTMLSKYLLDGKRRACS